MDEIQVTEQVVDVAPSEKMVPQSKVNELIAAKMAVASQRAREEAEREYQRKIEELNATRQAQAERNETVSRDVDADAIYQQVQEKFNAEMQQRQIESQMSQVAQNYIARVNDSRGRYEDFDAVTAEFDPTAFPQLVYLVSGLENAGDIVYELAKNPSKLVTLDALAQRAPRQAQAELVKLSRSIADNQQALQAAQGQATNAPLDRLQASRVNASGSPKSVADFRSQPWLRG